MSQSLAFKIFRRDEAHRINLADLEHGEYVGMVQCGSCKGFLFKTTEALAIQPHLWWQNLQRNFTMKLRIFRQINFAHPALANLCADFVTAEFCSRSKGHLASRSTVTRKLRVTTEISFCVLIRRIA